jgi:hypothetical protein
LQINFQMFVGYTILVRLTFILLTELSQAPIKMLEDSKYVLQINPVATKVQGFATRVIDTKKRTNTTASFFMTTY